jgi:hypothetical protein
LYKTRLGENWQRLQAAGEALDRIVDIWNGHGWILPEEAQQASKTYMPPDLV